MALSISCCFWLCWASLISVGQLPRAVLARPLGTLGFPFWAALQVIPSNGVLPSVELWTRWADQRDGPPGRTNEGPKRHYNSLMTFTWTWLQPESRSLELNLENKELYRVREDSTWEQEPADQPVPPHGAGSRHSHLPSPGQPGWRFCWGNFPLPADSLQDWAPWAKILCPGKRQEVQPAFHFVVSGCVFVLQLHHVYGV